jgi:hypothetical protein
MKQNFFESLGFADVERIHSQMLAWLFESEVLGAAQKSQILEQLVGRADDYEVRKVFTEHEHVDILIETASSIIAIENKIKITEHDNQLVHYQQALEGHTKPRRFVYLSLVPEAISASNWTARTYAELHAALQPHVFRAPSNFGEHAFNEYVEAVGHLTEIVREFDKDHTKFPNVFEDGSLTKRQKLEKSRREPEYTDLQNAVRTNQLETPLQRYFLEKIRRRILPETNDYRIEESHGVANINIVIVKRSIGESEFDLAVQFQGKTSKLNCYAHDYKNSTRDQLPAEVLAHFTDLAKKHKLRVNPGQSKAYISLSKALDFDWSDSFETIVKSYQTAYDDLSEIGKSITFSRGGEISAR